MPRLVAALALLAFTAPGLPGDHPPAGQGEAMDLNVFTPPQLKWADGPASLPPGAKMAVLEGDPTKAGPFVMRLKVPDGYRIAPHTHPKPERITVIAGTFHVGMGNKFDATNGKAMPAGSFGTWPAGMKHYVWVTGETVVQLHGVGPWVIEYLDPADDPRKKK